MHAVLPQGVFALHTLCTFQKAALNEPAYAKKTQRYFDTFVANYEKRLSAFQNVLFSFRLVLRLTSCSWTLTNRMAECLPPIRRRPITHGVESPGRAAQTPPIQCLWFTPS